MSDWRKTGFHWLAAAFWMACPAIYLHVSRESALDHRYYIWWEEDRSPAMLEQKAALEEWRGEIADPAKQAQANAWLALYKKRHPYRWSELKAETISLPGILPEAIRTNIPPDGRIEDAKFTAAIRMLVAVTGEPA